MLAQVRFPTELRIADTQALAGFQHAIRQDWPHFEQEQQFRIVLGAQGVQQAGSAGVFRLPAIATSARPTRTAI
jgi:uncharacterized protein (TIGR04255 family)